MLLMRICLATLKWSGRGSDSDCPEVYLIVWLIGRWAFWKIEVTQSPTHVASITVENVLYFSLKGFRWAI